MTASLTIQLITVSIITLQRQLSHNRLANRNEWNSEYDFVVVGAGTAGCVVAARLSENTNFRVLLIEAGGPESVVSDMPGFGIASIINPEINWGFVSTTQLRAGMSYANPHLDYGNGKIMGGSSSTFLMIYGRGNRRVYDRWVTQYGANGWSYDELLPYFIRAENNSDSEIVRQNRGFHGTSGPLAVSSPSGVDPVLKQMLDMFVQLGYASNLDMNGANQLGATIVQQFIDSNGVRSTTSNAYLQPVYRSRPNLHIISRSLVTRILTRLTRNNTRIAYGVSFTRNDRKYTVNAKREVIVTAGTFKSPQLLMLSGIGPADHLQQLHIPVVADLAVGDNLVDRLNTNQLYSVINVSQLNAVREPDIDMLYEYYTLGTGQLSRLPLVYVYINSALNNEPEIPDAVLLSLAYNTARVSLNSINVNTSQLINTFAPQYIPEWRSFFDQFGTNMSRLVGYGFIYFRPQSRGTVRLASRDPTTMPLIDPKYHSDARDLAVSVSVLSELYKTVESDHFRRLFFGPAIPVPGCRTCGPTVPLSRCYAYMACVIQTISFSEQHFTGTCRMGSATDPKAVVDERLRVRGVSRLRVIDASIFPECPNGNPYAIVVMAAEKGSDMIKEDNN